MRSVTFAILCAVALRAEVTYRVRLSASEGGEVVELSSERYVATVLAGEAGTVQNVEPLKALAVAARTYAAYTRPRHQAQGYDFCATTHCQRAILKDATERFLKATEATHGNCFGSIQNLRSPCTPKIGAEKVNQGRRFGLRWMLLT